MACFDDFEGRTNAHPRGAKGDDAPTDPPGPGHPYAWKRGAGRARTRRQGKNINPKGAFLLRYSALRSDFVLRRKYPSMREIDAQWDLKGGFGPRENDF